MTISKAFIDWLEEKGVATFGQDLYLRRLPDSKYTPSSVYWVIPGGGAPLGKNKTGEIIKQYTFIVNYRSKKAEEVDDKLDELENLLSCEGCFKLNGYEVIDVEVSTYPTDGDTDNEDREQGLLQANIKTYKQRC